MIDTHAHLDDPQLVDDLSQHLDAARAAGVSAVISIGCNLTTSRAAVALAAEHDMVFAAVGIQPNYCGEVQAEDWPQILELAGASKVVALGETGLDRYWDDAPFDIQQEYFDRHLRLSQESGMPFVVHMRDCQEDILVMLREARRRGPLTGVMHSFTGDQPGAAECVELGLHISFAGMVTFKKSEALRAVAASVPDDRILVETDSPYLTPHPHRGKRPNHPAMVQHTAACLAAVRGVTAEAFEALTDRNAQQLFRLPR